jgi:hypothetical protein
MRATVQGYHLEPYGSSKERPNIEPYMCWILNKAPLLLPVRKSLSGELIGKVRELTGKVRLLCIQQAHLH